MLDRGAIICLVQVVRDDSEDVPNTQSFVDDEEGWVDSFRPAFYRLSFQMLSVDLARFAGSQLRNLVVVWMRFRRRMELRSYWVYLLL